MRESGARGRQFGEGPAQAGKGTAVAGEPVTDPFRGGRPAPVGGSGGHRQAAQMLGAILAQAGATALLGEIPWHIAVERLLQQGQTQGPGQLEVHCRGTFQTYVGPVGDSGDIQCRSQRLQTRHVRSQGVGHPLADQGSGALRETLVLGFRQHSLQYRLQGPRLGLQMTGGGPDHGTLTEVAQQPGHARLRQIQHRELHFHLGTGRHLAVEPVDGCPEGFQPVDVADREVGLDGVRGGHPLGIREPEGETRTHAIEDFVGHFVADDFPAQAMAAQPGAETCRQPVRKVAFQDRLETGLIGEPGLGQRLVELQFGVGEQNRQLGAGEPQAGGGTGLELGITGQSVELAGDAAVRFQGADLAGMLTEQARCLRRHQAERTGLPIAVAQHQLGHLVGEIGEQRVALPVGQLPLLHGGVEQDLDVDLVIRAIHPPGIVDGIGVDPPPGQCKLDPRALGDAQVAALANHPAAQLPGVDAHAVVAAIADFEMGFLRRFHEHSDTAVPQQVHRRPQQCLDQRGGGQLVGLDGERAAHLRRQPDRLGGARENAAAGRQAGAVVVVPARTRQREQPCPLLEGDLGVRVRIDEDVAMVEGGEQAQLA